MWKSDRYGPAQRKVSLFRGVFKFDRDRISFGDLKFRAFSSLLCLLVLDSDWFGPSVIVRSYLICDLNSLLIPNGGNIQEGTDVFLLIQISSSFHYLNHIVGKVTSVRVAGLCNIIWNGFGLGHSTCMGSALARKDVFGTCFFRMCL